MARQIKFILILLTAIGALFFIITSTYYFSNSGTYVMFGCYSWHGELMESYFGSPSIISLLMSKSYYPPLSKVLNLALFKLKIWDYHKHCIVASLFTFFGCLLLAIYAYLESQNIFTALITFNVFSALPGTIGLGRFSCRDVFFLWAVPLTFIMLKLSTRTKKALPPILLGASVGLGMLIKWTFIVFVLPIVLAEVFRSPKNYKLVLKRLFLIALGSILVAGWWYAFYFDWTNFIFSTTNQPAGIKFFDRAIFAFTVAFIHFLGPVGTLLLLYSLIASAKDRTSRIWIWFTCGIAFSLLVFPLFGNIEARYLLGIIPIFSILISTALAKKLSTRKGGGITVFLVLMLYLQALMTVFGGHSKSPTKCNFDNPYLKNSFILAHCRLENRLFSAKVKQNISSMLAIPKVQSKNLMIGFLLCPNNDVHEASFFVFKTMECISDTWKGSLTMFWFEMINGDGSRMIEKNLLTNSAAIILLPTSCKHSKDSDWDATRKKAFYFITINKELNSKRITWLSVDEAASFLKENFIWLDSIPLNGWSGNFIADILISKNLQANPNE